MSVVRTLIGNVKGPKGDTGSQGPQGVAGTIEIGSVQTVSYGSPASVTNSGTEEEAILDFQIPQGAPGAQVTDMSNLVLSTITDSTADYPAFAVSETGSTIFGKIRKFLSDLKTKYVSKSMMTTSTDVDTAGQAVADAKAIKSLNDSLSKYAFPIVSGSYDIETIGNYKQIQSSNTSSSSFVTASGEHLYTLLSWTASDNNKAWQMAITTEGKVWTRAYIWWNSAWGAWRPTTPITYDYTFTVSGGISAGTIGTRGAQESISDPYHNKLTLIGVVITGMTDSSSIHPVVFKNGETLYCNWYRASSSAIGESSTRVGARFIYI